MSHPFGPNHPQTRYDGLLRLHLVSAPFDRRPFLVVWYQAEERRKSEMSKGRLSFVGRDAPQIRRQSLSGVPSASSLPGTSDQVSRYGMIMRGHRDSLAMGRRFSVGARQPTTLNQNPRPVSTTYTQDSLMLGPRPSRKQPLSSSQGYPIPHGRRSSLALGQRAGVFPQHFYTMDSRVAHACHQQRRDSVYGTMVANPQSMASVQMPRASHLDPSTYTEMIGGFPGIRRGSLTGHYEHT